MPNQRSSASGREKPEVVAAQEELTVLEKLSQGLSTIISDLLRQKPNFDRRDAAVEISIHESQYSTLKGYQELAKHCYGRTVVGDEIDEDGRPLRPFSFRITQANVGFVDKGCNVLARNSPIASKLVTADPGDESEISAPGGLRYLIAKQVRTFDGPTSLISSTQKPNFRSMVLRLVGRKNSIAVQNIRSFVSGLINEPVTAVASTPPSVEVRPGDLATIPSEIPAVDPTWLDTWQGIHLGDSETSSLSHQFFTRTTSKQENALNKPRGLTFVEGIAGSGKTSIALGRLKFFANFSTGEEREHYGLRNAPVGDFSPTNMVGFVLSHSLKRYLKETAAELGLEHLPIRDFQEFRSDLSNRFGLTRKFKRSQTQVAPCRTKLAWLLMLDVAFARAIGVTLMDYVTKNPDIPTSVRKTIAGVASELVKTQIEPSQAEFNLRGFASRLIDVVMRAEFKAREEAIQERINRETNRNVRYDLRNELERLARDEERHAISPLGRALLGLINIGNLVAEVARSRDLEVLAKESFENQSGHSSHEVSDAVAAFRHEMAGEDDKVRSVTDADLVALIVLSAMIASGFDRLDAPAQLYQIRRNTAAFIDEVQDFREIEVMLMGMVVTDTYHQITLAGDRRQQLQAMGTDDLRNLFPFVPRSLRNQTVFLDRNFRQRKDLRVLSEGIRSVLQEGAIVQRERDSSTATVHTFRSHSGMVQFIVSRLLTVDPYATAAFIMPSESEARRWYELLREELAAYHRPALLSHRDDLTRRNDIHFTEAREAKGLEFDVVVVPDVSAFDLESDIGKNQLYVAISRPRHALLLGCEHQSASGASLQKLEEAKIVSMVPIQEPSVH